MRLLVWWPALDSEIMSPQHFNNFIGCQYNIVSPSNFVYSCTKYTQNEHHPTLLIKSLPQQICNPVLFCDRPVPANIILQGHVSNSAREAFPMQDLLHGTVSHITFEKSRTLRDSKDNLKLFCFKVYMWFLVFCCLSCTLPLSTLISSLSLKHHLYADNTPSSFYPSVFDSSIAQL